MGFFRDFHRLAMSVCLSVCLSVCVSPPHAIFFQASHWPTGHMTRSQASHWSPSHHPLRGPMWAPEGHMSRVTCHVSCVTYHMSGVTCHYFFNQIIFCFFILKDVKLVGGGSVINRSTPSSIISRYSSIICTN